MQSTSLGYGSYPLTCPFIKPGQHQTKYIFKEMLLVFCLDDFLTARPINWCLNTTAKMVGRERAKGDKGEQNIVHSKLFMINSHWRRQREMKGSCVYLCFLSVLLRFFLLLHQGSCLAVSEWLSWEKHQYPFIRTISHISHHRDTHSPVSNLQSARWHFNLRQVLTSDYKRAEEGKNRLSSFVGWNIVKCLEKTKEDECFSFPKKGGKYKL